jgi:flagellar protein FlaG
LEKAIATVLLTVAGVVAVMAVLNALTPAIARTSSAIVASADGVDNRISTQIEIIHAFGVSGTTIVEAWTKNVGTIEVGPITHVDVFFGPEDNFVRIPYGGPSCSAPCWDYVVENATDWTPTATLKITLTLVDTLVGGDPYYIKIVTPNGVSDARFFTV